MTSWIATGFGALDVSEHPNFMSKAELLVTGTYAIEPVGLDGESARIYNLLVSNSVAEKELTDAELELIHQFEEFGLASTELDSDFRIKRINQPWFSSPMHELVGALIASIARRENIDLIFIKGPVLYKQGLRTKQHSGDVDVLVSPEDLERMVEAVEFYGWERQIAFWDGTSINHSVALSAPKNWGCEIDIHEYFPGIGLDAPSAFATLKASSDNEQFAGVNALVPNRSAHAVLFALHQIRPEFGQSLSSVRSDEASNALIVAGKDGVEIARRLKADAALHPLLQGTSLAVDANTFQEIPLNWKWRSQRNLIFGYFYALKSLPFITRFRILGRLIWPSKELTWASDKLAKAKSKTLRQARIARYIRGYKSIFKK